MFNQPKPSCKTKEPFIYPHHPHLHPLFNTTKDRLKSRTAFLLKNEVQKRCLEDIKVVGRKAHLTYVDRVNWGFSALVIGIYEKLFQK